MNGRDLFVACIYFRPCCEEVTAAAAAKCHLSGPRLFAPSAACNRIQNDMRLLRRHTTKNNIIVIAVRHCAGLASTLITHKHSPKEAKSIGKNMWNWRKNGYENVRFFLHFSSSVRYIWAQKFPHGSVLCCVVLTLTHHYNAVRGHRTGSNTSGTEDYLRKKTNKNRR